jgi:hypothetical protein
MGRETGLEPATPAWKERATAPAVRVFRNAVDASMARFLCLVNVFL